MDPLLTAIVTIAGAIAAGWLVARLFGPGDDGLVEPATTIAQPASWSSGLARTRGGMARRLLSAWTEGGAPDEWLSRAEETLLSSDVGMTATTALVARWRRELGRASSEEEVRRIVRDAVCDLLTPSVSTSGAGGVPHVILVVGVNGVGKTTTIGKLAHRFLGSGRKVLLVAGDTFRAAAIDQLQRWAERTGAELVRHQHGADPSAVVFDGVNAARARGADVVIIDTAGRLHVKANLMEEVKKVARTAGKAIAGAPHEVLLVIDATTGQNALNQARVFHEALGVDGVVLTKLDGTAKGGVALAIVAELGLPIRYVGLGEAVGDLAEFDPAAFAGALVSDTSP
jgi:fused signal recognition particle receptor